MENEEGTEKPVCMGDSVNHKKSMTEKDIKRTIFIIFFSTMAMVGIIVLVFVLRRPGGASLNDRENRLFGEDYMGKTCYAVVSGEEGINLKKTEDFANRDLWVVPTYEPTPATKTLVDKGVTIQHKTKVYVYEEEKQPRYCKRRHDWHYLLVQDLSSGQDYHIKPDSLVLDPYWEDDDSIMKGGGFCIAEYSQVSGHLPVTRGHLEVDLENGTFVLITGALYDGLDSAASTNPVEGWIWREWEYSGYKADTVLFNAGDLKIVY